jgi:hypothetical protein
MHGDTAINPSLHARRFEMMSHGNLEQAHEIMRQLRTYNQRCEKVPTDLTDALYAIMSQTRDLPPSTLFRYHRGQVLRHLRSHQLYMITGMPWEHMSEATGELMYAYRRVVLVQGPAGGEHVARGVQYLRAMWEMEDGRFATP